MPLRLIKPDHEHTIEVQGTKITFRQLSHGDMLQLRPITLKFFDTGDSESHDKIIDILTRNISEINGYPGQDIEAVLRQTVCNDFMEIIAGILAKCNLEEVQKKK